MTDAWRYTSATYQERSRRYWRRYLRKLMWWGVTWVAVGAGFMMMTVLVAMVRQMIQMACS